MSSKDRRKSEKLDPSPGLITLVVSPGKLRAIFRDAKDSSHVSTPAPATPLPAAKDDDNATASPNNATASNDNASDTTPNTPSSNNALVSGTTNAKANGGIEGTPDPSQSSAALPDGAAAEDGAAKKKGVKRSAAVAGVDGPGSGGPGSTNGDTPTPAARGRSRPGPKKKAKLDDGMVEVSRGGGGAGGGAHKLGPKASMGAINAGLRALDRSGKPCRRWAKGGFQLKSFTGVSWAVPRWKAPVKLTEPASGEESVSASASADGSNKENDRKGTGAGGDSGSGSGNKGDERKPDTKDSKAAGGSNGVDAVVANGAATNGAADSEKTANGHVTGAIAIPDGETPAASDVEMTNAPTTAEPSPSVEPATEVATPVAAAA